jgi:glycosyltransferase involved in cell wall biosynthesis
MRVLFVLDVAFAIPGDLDLPTGGYAYARKILALLPDYGVAAHHLPLPGSYPHPPTGDLARTRHIFQQLAPETLLLIDGLAFGAMPPEFVNAISQPIIALCHHPLAYETGVSREAERRFRAFETHALGKARHVIVSSRETASLLVREFDVPEARITVAEPGTAPSVRARGSGPGQPVALLAVGSVIPRKGYDVLVRALEKLADLDWHLTIVGATELDPACVTTLREQILKSGLRSRITLAGRYGEHELQGAYAAADVFVMASHYEGYGMVLTEALARGLPIVCTTGGAMARTAPDDAALKLPPADPDAIADALREVVTNEPRRRKLSDAAWEQARRLPRWENTAERIANALKNVHKKPGAEQAP